MWPVQLSVGGSGLTRLDWKCPPDAHQLRWSETLLPRPWTTFEQENLFQITPCCMPRCLTPEGARNSEADTDALARPPEAGQSSNWRPDPYSQKSKVKRMNKKSRSYPHTAGGPHLNTQGIKTYLQSFPFNRETWTKQMYE